MLLSGMYLETCEEMMNTVKKKKKKENSALVKSEHPSPEPEDRSSQTLLFHLSLRGSQACKAATVEYLLMVLLQMSE